MPSVPGFEGFSQLSEITYFKDKRTTTANEKPAPMLIICTWMNAPAKVVGKYLTQYETLFPESSILLILSSTSTLFFAPQGQRSGMLTTAIDVLRTAQQPATYAAAAYSNGGVSSLNDLCELYRIRKRAPLQIDRLLLDSAPGDPDEALSERTHRAFYRGFPPYMTDRAPLNWITSTLLWWFLLLWGKFIQWGYTTNPILGIKGGLHDEKRYGKGRRTYVYSKSDDIMAWEGVLKSADESEKQGWEVRREEFEGSKHVAHAMKDKERYWKIVEETLEDDGGEE